MSNTTSTTPVSKGTIVRTAAAILVVVNLVLKSLGLSPLDIEEGSILAFLEVIIEGGIIVASWWYNNSLTEKAKKAQEYLQKLKDSDAE